MNPALPQSTAIFSDPWQLVLAMAVGGSAAGGWLLETEAGRAEVYFDDSQRGWGATAPVSPEAKRMLDLYVPLLRPKTMVVAHLGQSVDGFIAGADGKSQSLNDRENIVHLHRLRALFDVVLVGRSTACVDDPRLTTRLVDGPNPTRVVIDPQLRSNLRLRMFSDDAATTLLACGADAPDRPCPKNVEVLRLGVAHRELTTRTVLAALRERGLDRVFIEGGGHTVSRALQEGVLDRLHVAVAPLFIGEGVRGVRIEGLRRFADAIRPSCESFEMGQDVLFDFELSSHAAGC